MKSQRQKDKSSSLKKSAKATITNIPKAMSVRELPKYPHSSSGKKTLKDTKRKYEHNTNSIEQRVANIKKGFLELENKLFLGQHSKGTIKDSDVKRLIESASKSSRTKRDTNEKTPHKCVYEKAVYSLISIIDQQKSEIEFLRREVLNLKGKHNT
jgi:hypothetical protein